MLRTLREQFLILGAQSMVKNCMRGCVICARHWTVTGEQIMVDLPKFRVNLSRPLNYTGLDYAGYFSIRDASGRGRKSHKALRRTFSTLARRREIRPIKKGRYARILQSIIISWTPGAISHTTLQRKICDIARRIFLPTACSETGRGA